MHSLWKIPVQHSFATHPQMKAWFESLHASAVSRHNYKMLEVRGYLNLICAELAKTVPENDNGDSTLEADRKKMEAMFDVKALHLRATKSTQKNDPRITVILDYITSHPEENLTREQMCQMADISESTLRRLFKEKTGKTIYEFVTETKMTNAARRLLVTNDAVATIAYDLGYEAPSYFGKCFKAVFGLSPQEYRKSSHEM